MSYSSNSALQEDSSIDTVLLTSSMAKNFKIPSHDLNNSFTDSVWNELVQKTGSALKLTSEETARLKANIAAKLVTAIGYIAEFSDPDRYAIANLTTFVAAQKVPEIFSHRESDNSKLERRFASFAKPEKDYKQKAYRYGILLLELISLADHKKDFEADKKLGKYNPLAKGAWDFEKKVAGIKSEIKKLKSIKSIKDYDEIITAEKAVIVSSWSV